jgi:hypothetical protein
VRCALVSAELSRRCPPLRSALAAGSLSGSLAVLRPADAPCLGAQIDFWDTAGQERFNSMHPAYYHMAHACIMCFDVTRKQTYKNLPAWYKELRDYRAGIPVRASGPLFTHPPLATPTVYTHMCSHPLAQVTA